MSLNWDDILDDQTNDTSGYAPAGPYTVRVASAEGVIAQSGNPMVKVKVEIVGGPYNGTPVWTNIVIIPSNANLMRFTLRKLAGLGISRDWLRQANPDHNQIAKVINDAAPLVQATLEVSEYNDEKRNEIKAFKALDDATPQTPTPTATKAPTVPKVPTPPSGGNTVPSPASTPSVPQVPTPPAEDAPPVDDEPNEPF